MGKLFLFLVITLLFINDCNADASNKIAKLFIMLNVDNTILDRVDPNDLPLIKRFSQNGYAIQKLEFNATTSSSPKFVNMYYKLSKGEEVTNESEYMSRVKVTKISQDSFHITEYIVIRPSLKRFLESLNIIDIPVYVLLCSRNDDARTKNLAGKLNLSISGKKFSEVVKFVPRNMFRVKIKSESGHKISAKSSVELRKQYTEISDDDFVVLIDKLEDYRFIKSDSNKDLNIKVSRFIAKDEYDKIVDNQEMGNVICKIREFIGG